MNIIEYIGSRLGNSSRKSNYLLEQSEVFCMAPWIQLHAQTTGKVAPCCMSFVDGETEIGDLRQNPDWTAAWNSANMKRLRLNMLEGKKSVLCTHCYQYEKVGKESERMKYNRDYKEHFPKVKATMPDGSLTGLKVPVLDIRFSNKCNYKCRICDSVYSSLLYEEEQKTGKQPGLPSAKEMKIATDEPRFWESTQRLLEHVERLHFAGGEPLVMDEHYRTLEYLIASGKTNVALSYNTNFSTLRYKQYNIVDLWNRFEKVDVWASLDGMGAKGDYQRKGQRWGKIEENIREVQKNCPKVIFGINVTVNILNILHIPEFYRYMVENDFVQPDRMNLYLLFFPEYFNITSLTPGLKQRVNALYGNFEREYLESLENNSNIKNHVHAVLNYMNSQQGTHQQEFSHWIKTIDAVRNEKFEETFPELRELVDSV